jgi:hypothetical protein
LQICFESHNLPPSQKAKVGVINPGFSAGSSSTVFN